MSAFFDDDELLKNVSPSEDDDDDDFDVDDAEDILEEKEADDAAKKSTAPPANPPSSPHQSPFGTPVNNVGTNSWSTNTGNNTWRPTFTPAGGNTNPGQTIFPGGNTWNNGGTWNNGQQNQFGNNTWNNGGYRPSWSQTGNNGSTWGGNSISGGKQSLPRQKKIIMCDLLDNVIEPLSAQGRTCTQPQGIYDMRIKFEVLDRFRAINPEYLFILTNQNFTPGTTGEKVFKAMVDYLVLAIAEYMRIPYENVRCFVKTGYDIRDPFVKPNVGLMQTALKGIPDLKEKYKKDDILVCGSASGLAGQGNRDIEMAKRFGVDYIDIQELLSYYF